MTKVLKSAVTSGFPKVYSFDTLFEGYKIRYPLRKARSCHLEAKVYREKEEILVDMKGEATFEAEDTSDASPFLYSLSIDEKGIAIMEKEDGEGDGFIFEGNSFDLEELALDLFECHIPLRLLKSMGKPL